MIGLTPSGKYFALIIVIRVCTASSRKAVSDNLYWMVGGAGLAFIVVVVMMLVLCFVRKRNSELKEKVTLMKKLNVEDNMQNKGGPQATPFMDE